MKFYKKPIFIIILSIFFIITGYVGIYIQNMENNFIDAKKSTKKISAEINDDIHIHIKGAVKNEGTYTLHENDRVEDAIKAAGGQTEDANLEAINLVKPLFDSDEIFIPKKGEDFQITKSGKININKAEKETLKQIPGISDKIADKIIEFRNNYGSFKNISDIKKVNGIGDKTYIRIKDFIIAQ